MLSTLIKKLTDATRESMFLACVLVLVVGLLSAMYWVCDAQTQRAQERRALLETQRLAVRDCMAAVPPASYAQCRQEVALRFDPLGTEPQTTHALLAEPPVSRVTMLVPVAYIGHTAR